MGDMADHRLELGRQLLAMVSSPAPSRPRSDSGGRLDSAQSTFIRALMSPKESGGGSGRVPPRLPPGLGPAAVRGVDAADEGKRPEHGTLQPRNPPPGLPGVVASRTIASAAAAAALISSEQALPASLNPAEQAGALQFPATQMAAAAPSDSGATSGAPPAPQHLASQEPESTYDPSSNVAYAVVPAGSAGVSYIPLQVVPVPGYVTLDQPNWQPTPSAEGGLMQQQQPFLPGYGGPGGTAPSSTTYFPGSSWMPASGSYPQQGPVHMQWMPLPDTQQQMQHQQQQQLFVQPQYALQQQQQQQQQLQNYGAFFQPVQQYAPQQQQQQQYLSYQPPYPQQFAHQQFLQRHEQGQFSGHSQPTHQPAEQVYQHPDSAPQQQQQQQQQPVLEDAAQSGRAAEVEAEASRAAEQAKLDALRVEATAASAVEAAASRASEEAASQRKARIADAQLHHERRKHAGQLARHGQAAVPGEEDLVTVWLSHARLQPRAPLTVTILGPLGLDGPEHVGLFRAAQADCRRPIVMRTSRVVPGLSESRARTATFHAPKGHGTFDVRVFSTNDEDCTPIGRSAPFVVEVQVRSGIGLCSLSRDN
jgi:hypothetical protein